MVFDYKANAYLKLMSDDELLERMDTRPAIMGNNIFDTVNGQGVSWRTPFSPFQLVTLYDLMKFYSENFLAIVSILGRLRNSLHSLEVLLDDERNPEALASWERKNKVLDDLRRMKVECDGIGLREPVRQIDTVLRRFSGNDLRFEYLRLTFENIEGAIIGGFSDIFLVRIATDKVFYYENPFPFGMNVANRFPSASYDIEEASKCFAMSRYTACVMHLQRVLEVSLKSYGNCLGIMHLIATPQPSWQNVLDKTGKEIKDRSDKSITVTNWASKEEREFCEGVQPFLVAVKITWRNPAMHADKTYTEERAAEIFNAIKTFMHHLAAHLDEAGNFTA